MKAIFGIGAFFAVVFGIVWLLCMKSVTVEPGNEVVFIDRPLMWGHEGVRQQTLKEGREYVWESTAHYVVPTIPVTYHLKFDDLMTSDKIMLDFESTVQLQITDPVKMVSKFGPDWYKNNVQAQFVNTVRDAVKSVTMAQIMSDSETSKRIDNEIKDALAESLKSKGVPVEVVSAMLGRGIPNAEVAKSINNTAAEIQRRQTMIASTQAEEERAKNETQRAKSDLAYQQTMNISTEQFVELQKAKLMAEACEHSSNCIVMNGTSASTVLPIK